MKWIKESGQETEAIEASHLATPLMKYSTRRRDNWFIIKHPAGGHYLEAFLRGRQRPMPREAARCHRGQLTRCNPAALQWVPSSEIALELLGNCSENVAWKLLGNDSNVALKSLWNCPGIVSKIARKLLWKYCSEISLWNWTGNAQKLLENCSGTTRKLLGNCPKTALELLWRYSTIVLISLWNWTGSALKLLWNCSEIALKLLWNCSETETQQNDGEINLILRRRGKMALKEASMELVQIHF